MVPRCGRRDLPLGGRRGEALTVNWRRVDILSLADRLAGSRCVAAKVGRRDAFVTELLPRNGRASIAVISSGSKRLRPQPCDNRASTDHRQQRRRCARTAIRGTSSLGKCRLPFRHTSSKLCATLDFSRRLRVDEKNHSKTLSGTAPPVDSEQEKPSGDASCVVFFGDPARVREGFALALRAMGVDQSEPGENLDA